MKKRLQKLWDETVPQGGGAPCPDANAVLQRVDAALDGTPRKSQTRRILRRAVLIAAVLLLLTVFSIAANGGEPPLRNVIDAFFWESSDRALASSLIDDNPITISDDQYTMTVTSSAADKNKVYLTLNVVPKNEEAKARLQAECQKGEAPAILSFRTYFLGDSSGSESSGINPETGIFESEVSRQLLPWPFSRSISIRCSLMEEKLWLKVPIHPISSVRMEINATAPGGPSQESASGGPVTIKKLVISPMSVFVQYTTPVDEIGEPVLYFLWKDGTVNTLHELGMIYPSGSGVFGDTEFSAKYTYKFDGIQDLTKMEAVIFGDMAYPLDGGTPYAYDTSGLPFPFRVSGKENENGECLVPLSEFCRGLGSPENQDIENGTATIIYRGKTIHCKAEDKLVRIEDGEFWVSGSWVSINLEIAIELVSEGDMLDGSFRIIGIIFSP